VPFRASLAVSSDCDATDSPEEFLAMWSFLAGSGPTPWGEGLGLEIGGSFWFFDPTGRSTFTYCRDMGGTLADAAPVIERAVASGHLDVVHGWGDFSEGGFERRDAETACAHLEGIRRRTGVKLETWVNHGNAQNRLRIGLRPADAGDDPGAPEYHLDLTRAAGIRFVHGWEITHVVGQERPFGLRDRGKILAEHAADLVGRLKGRPSYPRKSGNDLTFVRTYDDGSRLWAFRRFLRPWFGGASASAADLPEQLSPQVLDELVSNRGAMIVYTHLGGNGERAADWLSPEVVAVFRDLAERNRRGELLLATTTRLLRFQTTRKCLVWSWRHEGDVVAIDVESVDDPVSGRHIPRIEELMGIGFSLPPGTKTARIRVGGADLPEDTVQRAQGEDGRPTIGLPWIPVRWPFEPGQARAGSRLEGSAPPSLGVSSEARQPAVSG
jgi:hypothetical protein